MTERCKGIGHGIVVFGAVLVFFFAVGTAGAGVVMEDPMNFGISLGDEEDRSDLEICPEGSSVIGMFLHSWKKGDYRAMYDLVDDASKEGYAPEQAEFDFRMLPFEEYRISSVSRAGDDFEFILSSGDWKYGDKDITKMIISGKTFRIIMPTKHSPFKRSAEDYF
ncbi:MAG: hypothetical protein ABIG55_02470 [Candidatus Omnitrophota bacterium]